MNSSGKQEKPNSLKAWMRLARIPFLTATIIPAILGAVIAWTYLGTFNAAYFALTIIGVVCLHLGTNIINDYFDFKSGCDAINTEALSPISGGSRVLLENLVKPQSAYFVALSFFGLAAVMGAILSVTVGWWVLLLGGIGVISGYFYVTQLSTRGIGELIVGLDFGPLVVLGSYYVQTQKLALEPVIASIPVGLLVTAILWINEIPDYTADKTVGKKTLVVRVGRKRAADLYAVIVLTAFAWIVVMALLNQMPLFTLITLAALPLAVKAITVARKYYGTSRNMIAANLSTIKMQLSLGILLIVGYVLQTLVLQRF